MTGDALTWATVQVFEGVGLHLVGDAVKVELVTMAADAPMSGTVRWDRGAGCWRVLAADQVKGRRLLFLLFHELAHVVSGDVDKQQGLLGLDRAIMTGAARATAETDVRRRALERAGSGKYADREQHADAWAERLTARVWPVVEGLHGRLSAELQRG